jgi:hypothetical protein
VLIGCYNLIKSNSSIFICGVHSKLSSSIFSVCASSLKVEKIPSTFWRLYILILPNSPPFYLLAVTEAAPTTMLSRYIITIRNESRRKKKYIYSLCKLSFQYVKTVCHERQSVKPRCFFNRCILTAAAGR